MAEGRRRGLDKQFVGPLQAKLREVMLRVMLNLFGRDADDWIYRYRIEWSEAPGSQPRWRSARVR